MDIAKYEPQLRHRLTQRGMTSTDQNTSAIMVRLGCHLGTPPDHAAQASPPCGQPGTNSALCGLDSQSAKTASVSGHPAMTGPRTSPAANAADTLALLVTVEGKAQEQSASLFESSTFLRQRGIPFRLQAGIQGRSRQVAEFGNGPVTRHKSFSLF